MSSPLTVPDGPIARLLSDGFDMVLDGDHLVIRRIPYVSPNGLRLDGRLVLPVSYVGGTVTDATDHRIWFAGDEPRDDQGSPLGTPGQAYGFGQGETAEFMLSFKPPSGAYPSLREKVRHYSEILSSAARTIDPGVSARPGGSFATLPNGSPLVFADTNASRAGLTSLMSLFRGHTVAIVGVGGTGSYILDHVAKTWVDKIIVVDGDVFEPHNAFRAPGAAAESAFSASRNKAEYFAAEYSRMHQHIIAHPVALTSENLQLIASASFVFLAAADSKARPDIMRFLRNRGIPFIDVGMSFRQGEGGLTGMVKVASYLPGDDVELPTAAAPEADEDDYASNIQVAELNSLNASLAVIRWKRHLGFYASHDASSLTVYKLFLNELRNGDL